MMDTPPILDRSMLERLQEWGGEELKGKMIELFMENGQERIDGVIDGFDREDWELAERSAHSLKSAAANLGAARLRTTAARVESLLESGQRAEAASSLDQLRSEFEEARNALAKERE